MNKQPKRQIIATPTRWILGIGAALISWVFVDTPSGTSESVEGRVTRSDVSNKGTITATVTLTDGSKVSKQLLSYLPVGTPVTCVRRQRRLSGSYDYKC